MHSQTHLEQCLLCWGSEYILLTVEAELMERKRTYGLQGHQAWPPSQSPGLAWYKRANWLQTLPSDLHTDAVTHTFTNVIMNPFWKIGHSLLFSFDFIIFLHSFNVYVLILKLIHLTIYSCLLFYFFSKSMGKIKVPGFMNKVVSWMCVKLHNYVIHIARDAVIEKKWASVGLKGRSGKIP